MSSPCPNKEKCGSCSWSHIPYDKQLSQKLADINYSFAQKGLSLRCTEILPSPKLYHYRNRMDFAIDFEGRVGLREKGKWWRVIDRHTCFIGEEDIEKCFLVVREWIKRSGFSYYDRKSHIGLLRYAVIRRSILGQVLVVLVTSAPENNLEEAKAIQALKELAQELEAGSVVWSINHTITDVSMGDEVRVISGKGYIEEKISDFYYRISPHAFFQTNSYAAPLLLGTVREYLRDLSSKVVLDLYCGTGFFSIALARETKKIYGIELISQAVHDARENARRNEVEVEYIEDKMEASSWEDYGADVLVLDPPRSGLHDKVLEKLLEVKPPKIVYVSCNHKNFAREMVKLAPLYKVVDMRAIDMFPHTPHVELVSLLVRM